VAISSYPSGQRALVEAARRLLELGLHSTSKHGNLSVRVPGRLAIVLSQARATQHRRDAFASGR
jgi:hypothetical protein